MGNMINLKINNIPVQVEAGTNIVDAAKQAGIKIPTLCYLKDINVIGACRVCNVEVKNARTLVAACVYPVTEGMEVFTNTKRVIDSRRKTVELILSDHDQNCLSCVRNTSCELQTLANDLGCDSHKFVGEKSAYPVEVNSVLVRDNNKCVLCRRCVAACKQYQSVSVIGPNGRGFDTHIGCAFEKSLSEVPCVGCGQCITVCPTGALREKDDIDDVIAALSDKSKYVIVATAPAVRVALGEEFDIPMGTNVEGKMVTALKAIGFKNVFDINFGADLTIMEEGYEFISRVTNKGVLPMITSCSPAWVKFTEHNYPELIPHLSSCKSPQQMFGAMSKSYFAERIGVKPEDIVMVSIMPCTAKKFEKGRANQSANGVPDIDFALTTRELARMIKRVGICFTDLPDSEFDAPLGIGSGAGLIFGATGGVMEAALRTVADVLEKKSVAKLDYTEIRGVEGVKEAVYKIAGMDVKVCVVSGLANARKIMELIKAGKADYHFIEVMSCPGGCVNGGGQPIKTAYIRNNYDIKSIRASAIYNTDKAMKLRKSHENPAIKELYTTYLGEPNGEKAHHLLHTKYEARKNY